MDIQLSSYDTSCKQDSDCTTIATGEICSGDCLCGGSPINVSGLPRYDAALASVPLGLCGCPAEAAPRCLGGQCTICNGPNGPSGCFPDAGPAPDAGKCVDVVPSSYDQSCQVDSDCIEITAGTICSPSCFCGGAAISASNQTKYNLQIAGIANADCPCAFAGTPQCVQHTCTICPPGAACSEPPIDAGGDASAAPCAATTDCPSNQVCGFPQTGGCSAHGTCFPVQQVTCGAFSAGCGCDGSEINLVCNGLPTGYALKPLLHSGMCVDGG